MNKKILSFFALLIASATLFSACTATFALQIPEYTGDDQEREDFPFSDLVPPDYSDDWGISGDISGSGDLPFSPDTSPDVPTPDPVSPTPTIPSPSGEHPFSTISWEQLAALLGQNFGSLEQVEGFYADYKYFVADFTKGKAEYHHMGKQLYAKNEAFTQSELEQFAQMLSIDNLIMMGTTQTADGQILQQYTVHSAQEYIENGVFSYLVLAYYDEQSNKQSCAVFHHFSGIEDTPSTEEEMPDTYYTPQWFDWLKKDDGKTYQKVKGVRMGSYNYQEGYDPSPFLPHGGSNTMTPELSPYKGGKLLLNLYMDRNEFFAGRTANSAYQPNYPYKWNIFYRKQGSSTPYKQVTIFPTTVGGNGMTCLYRLDVLNANMALQLNADGTPGVYEMIVVFTKTGTNKITAWFEEELVWSNASVAYQDLATYGYVREENKLPEVVEEMPDTYFTEEWFDWLKKDDGKTFQKVKGVRMGSYNYQEGYDASPFFPHGGSNTATPDLSPYMGGKLLLHLYMDRNEFYCTRNTTSSSSQQINYACKWYIFYREKGSSAPYKQLSPLHASSVGGSGVNCLYRLDVLGEGMALQLKSDGSPGVYEMLVVFASTSDSEKVAAWFESEITWSNASVAYQDLTTYGYVREENKLPELPAVEEMPERYYTEEWFTWLKNDAGRTLKKIQGVKMGSYKYKTGYDPSPFLPYGGTNNSTTNLSPYKGGKLLLHLYMDRDEFYCGKDASPDLSNEAYCRWTIFYRVKGSDTPYQKSVTAFPVTADGTGAHCLYRLNVLGSGMKLQLKADGSPNTYEILVVFTEMSTGTLAAWFESEIIWSNASVAYQDLVTYGYVREENLIPSDKELPPVPKVPQLSFTQEWIEWVKDDNGATLQKVQGVKMGSYKYKTGYDPSPFLPYGGTNTENPELSLYMGGKLMLLLYMDRDEFFAGKNTYWEQKEQNEYDYVWSIFYREKGSDAPYTQLNLFPTTSGASGKNCVYRLDVLSAGMQLELGADGSPGVYEMLVVFTDVDTEIPAAWLESEITWTNSSIAYQDLATYGYVREENQL
ncbi:MAG: hypothetical protein IJZ37_06715 [Clostridia bacterium]|nr:hypothetical protein [Clostridia bacterium]